MSRVLFFVPKVVIGAGLYVLLCGFFFFIPLGALPTDANKVNRLVTARDWHGLSNFATERLKESPADQALWDYRCLANINLKRLDDAERDCQESIRLSPNRESAINNLGLIRFYRGQYIEAMSYYEKAKEINPKSGVAFSNIVLVYHKMGQAAKTWDAWLALRDVDSSRARMVKEQLRIPDDRPADDVATGPVATVATAQTVLTAPAQSAPAQGSTPTFLPVTSEAAVAPDTRDRGNGRQSTSSPAMTVTQQSPVGFASDDGRAIQLRFDFVPALTKSERLSARIGSDDVFILNSSAGDVESFTVRIRANIGDKMQVTRSSMGESTTSILVALSVAKSGEVPMESTKYAPRVMERVVSDQLSKTYDTKAGGCVYLMLDSDISQSQYPERITLQGGAQALEVTGSPRLAANPLFAVRFTEAANVCAHRL